MAICVLFEFNFKPEALEQAEARLHQNLPDTRAWKGCRGLDVYRNPDDPCNILFIERWDSLEEYKEYDSWRVERGDLGEFKTYCAKPPERRHLDLTTI